MRLFQNAPGHSLTEHLSKMIKVQVCFDSVNDTWNVMQDNTCIFYGDILAVERWLLANKERHVEDD